MLRDPEEEIRFDWELSTDEDLSIISMVVHIFIVDCSAQVKYPMIKWVWEYFTIIDKLVV